MVGVAAVEAQPNALTGRDDLAQAAGVGDDAGAAAGHRLERDEAERFVKAWDHAKVSDPVERMEHVVADPAKKSSVVVEAKLLRLLLQLRFVGSGASDEKANLANPFDDRWKRLKR